MVGVGISFAVKSDDTSDRNAATATSTAESSSSTSRTTTSRTTTTSPPPGPTQGSAADRSHLISLLPQGIDPSTCKPIELKRTLARLQCFGNKTPGAPKGGIFALFVSQASLDGGFDATVSNFQAVPCPGGRGSPRNWTYQSDPNTPAGRIACLSADNGITWTNNRDLVLGYAIGDDITSLHDWWLEYG